MNLLALLLLAAPAMAQVANPVELRSVRGTYISTGTGPSDSGTIRVAPAVGGAPIPVTVTVSSIAIYNVAGSSIVIRCTDAGGALISCSSSGATTVTVTTGSITAFQGGAPWDFTGSTIAVSNFPVIQPVSQSGNWNVGQAGSYTVTPGTGTWNASGSSVTAFQGGPPWSVAQSGAWDVSGSTLAVTNVAGQNLNVAVSNFPATQPVSQVGAWTVTPGTGAWSTSGSTVTAYQGGPPWSVSQSGPWDVSGSTLAVTNVLGQNLNVVVSNFPATQPVSQAGAWTVTPGTGTWSTSGSTVSVSNFPATQAVTQSGAWTVTPGTGTWSTSGSTVTAYQGGAWSMSVSNFPATQNVQNVPGQALAVVSTGTVTIAGTVTLGAGAAQVGTFTLNSSSVVARQEGSYTVTPGTGTWSVSGSSVTAFQGGNWNVGQVGSYTVTPGTGTWSTSGSTVTAYVNNFPATQPVSQSGAWTVTPGTGVFLTNVTTGSVTAFQGGNWTVSATISTSTIISTGTITATIQSALIVPTLSSTTCAATSTQIFAANANRKSIECRALSSNTRDIFIFWDRAATLTDWQIQPGDYYKQPDTVISTTAVNCIASLAGQTIRCLQY